MSPSRRRAPVTERTTTRDGLIQAALHLFHERGYNAASVQPDRPTRLLLRLAFEPLLLPRRKA
jgi:hypothetical protein